jgi:hypothetical protein
MMSVLVAVVVVVVGSNYNDLAIVEYDWNCSLIMYLCAVSQN